MSLPVNQKQNKQKQKLKQKNKTKKNLKKSHLIHVSERVDGLVN